MDSFLSADWAPDIGVGSYFLSFQIAATASPFGIHMGSSLNPVLVISPGAKEWALIDAASLEGGLAVGGGKGGSVMSMSATLQFGYGDLYRGYQGFSENVSVSGIGVTAGATAAFNNEGQLLYRSISAGLTTGLGISNYRAKTAISDVNWSTYNLEYVVRDLITRYSSSTFAP